MGKARLRKFGAVEIEAIEVAVEEHFGRGAIDSPMIIARLLADEGAELRHSEIMELFVKRHAKSPYEAMFYNILKLADLDETAATIRNLENLRKKLASENDKEGLRLLARGAEWQKKATGNGRPTRAGRSAGPRTPRSRNG